MSKAKVGREEDAQSSTCAYIFGARSPLCLRASDGLRLLQGSTLACSESTAHSCFLSFLGDAEGLGSTHRLCFIHALVFVPLCLAVKVDPAA